MFVRTLSLVSAATMATIATPGNAATFLFEISGTRNATFQLDTNDVDRINRNPLLGGSQIFFDDVTGTFNGITISNARVNFGSGNILASLNIIAPGTGLGFTQFGGEDFFVETDDGFAFRTGSFINNGFVTGRNTVTISAIDVTAAIPEPATWLMLLMGFGLVGAALRHRPQTVRHLSYS